MFQTHKFALVCLGALALTSCNSSTQQFLNSVNLQVVTINNASHVQLTSTFSLGNVSISPVAYNITDPAAGGAQVGSINFTQLASTEGSVTLDVNASLLAHADPALGTSLPNSLALPLALSLQPGQSLGTKVGANSRVYLGGSLQTTLFAGIAIEIPGLDQVMSRLSSPANIFFSISPSTNLLGVGGLYASPTAAQNGVAIFAKYSAAGGMEEALDENQDNDFETINRDGQKDIQEFFFGEPKTIQTF